jgi:hypothetical protein
MILQSKEENKMEDYEAAHFEGGDKEEEGSEEIKHNSHTSAKQPTLQPLDPDLDGTLNENEVRLELNDLNDSSNIQLGKTPISATVHHNPVKF